MKVVVDTNVVIPAMLWGGKPHEVLERIERGRDIAFVTREILQELYDVLHRPKFAAALSNAGVDPADILRWTVGHFALIVPRPLTRVPGLSDQRDYKFLACAAACRADVLITGDKKHLIPLRRWRTTRIVSPETYHKRARKK